MSHSLSRRVRWSHADHRDRPDGPPRRRRRHRALRRHRRARHGQPCRPAPRPRLLPAHDRLRGADVRRRQDPRRLHQARVAPVGGRDPRLPPDGPPDPPALPGGLQGRRPVRHHGPLDRPGEQPGRPRDDRRVGRADDQRDPVPGPDRRRPHRAHRRRVRHQPDHAAARGERARPRRLRHARRDHDGRGRREDPARGRDGRGDPVRPPRARAAHRPPAGAAEGRRQAKRIPFLEPGTESVLDFAAKAKAGAEFVIVDVETTGTNAEMADLVEIAAVRVKGGKITDRWSTFVNPGRPIFGNQMHGITDKDVKGAPSPAEAAQEGARLRRRRHHRRPLGRLRHRLPRGRARRRDAHREGPLPRHADARTRRLPGPRQLHARRALASSSASSSSRPTAPSRTRRRRPSCSSPSPGELPGRLDALVEGIADSIRAQRTSKDEAKAKLEAARRAARVSKGLFGLVHKKTARKMTLSEGIRIDGRGVDEIRPITVEVGLVPRAHGSGLFTRGETQALTVATLGPSSDVQRIDTISPELEKRYIHHYNMPPYSTGENKFMRGPGRREIGHGHLAERALIPVLPSKDDFPYVIRLVSRVRDVQRLDLDGVDLRLHPRAHGCRRADLGAGRRRGDGPHVRARRHVHGPHRHPRQGGCLRRHGLQGHRHPRRDHRPPDGHQGQGHQRGDHPRGAGQGPRRADGDPRQDDRGPADRPRRR